MAPILGILASQMSGHLFTAGTFDSIATATPAGNNSITFSSITSAYTHLQIRYIARSSLAALGFAGMTINFNGDNGSNYAYHRLYGTGSVAQSDSGATQTTGYIGGAAAASNLANEFATGIVDILDYRSTSKNKTVRSLWGGDDNTNGANGTIHLDSTLWYATPAAITSVTFTLGSGQTFATNSQFALYGIKGA
jgi:hypothetical protein